MLRFLKIDGGIEITNLTWNLLSTPPCRLERFFFLDHRASDHSLGIAYQMPQLLHDMPDSWRWIEVWCTPAL